MSVFRQLMMSKNDINYEPSLYIQSSGTRSLDTGIYPDDTTVVQCKFVMTNFAGGYFIGNSGNGEADSFRFFRFDITTYLDYGSGNNYNRISTSYITSTTAIYEVEFGNRYIKNLLTNTVIKSASTVTFNEKTYPIKLFSENDYGKCYYLKIYKNNTLVRDFKPVYNPITGIYGFLDEVNQLFYEGNGTGNFSGAKLLYNPVLDGTEQITTMTSQNSPYITQNTLTGNLSGQIGGSGYLSEGWSNSGLWELEFDGWCSQNSSGLLLALTTDTRDYNLFLIECSGTGYVYNGSSGSSQTGFPSLTQTWRHIVIKKISSTSISVKVDTNTVNFTNFTALGSAPKCYIGVDAWATNQYAVIKNIYVTEQ